MNMNRRQFFKVCAAGLGGSSIALMGFSPTAALAEVRSLQARPRHRNPEHVSVLLGELRGPDLLHGRQVQERARRTSSTSRAIRTIRSIAARCAPRAPACWTWSTARTALKFPEVREAGSNEWKRISWDEALERIAKHMKADRDANFIAKNADGVTVNRWNTFGFLACSAASNESGYITHKVLRSLGVGRLRHPGPHLTRPHGGQSGSDDLGVAR